MRRVLVVGIGAGDPDHVTVQAVRALNAVDVLLLVDKGEAGAPLAAVRDEILARHLDPSRSPRRVTIPEVERDRAADDYQAAVTTWRAARRAAFRDALESLDAHETAAFLVWGDPALYDGTISLLEEVRTDGVQIDIEVIPGISAASALAAAHRVPLNRIGESILFTTGRRLGAHGIPDGVDNVVVFLDGGEHYREVDEDVDIWWGAFLATDDELLVSGPLAEKRDEVERVRREGRRRTGWMFDTYLLRRRR